MKLVTFAGGFGARVTLELQSEEFKPMLVIDGKQISWNVMYEYSTFDC